MAEERLYVVTYDIADQKRWRRVFKLMHGYGTWLQLSVFQCRLTARRRVELAARLERRIKADEDHVLILDLGPADKIDPPRREPGQVLRQGEARGARGVRRCRRASAPVPSRTPAVLASEKSDSVPRLVGYREEGVAATCRSMARAHR